MIELLGRSTNNSAYAMLDSSATSSAGSSSVANSVVPLVPMTTSSSFTLTAKDISHAFSRALSDSLTQILAAMQNQTSQFTASSVAALGSVPSSTCSSSFPVNSYCTLGNSSLSHPSLFGSHGASGGVLPATSHLFSPAFSTPTLAHSVASLLNKPLVTGPGYSPIPEKLVTKIKARQFVDRADLLPENVKAQDSKPQTYLDGKLLVS